MFSTYTSLDSTSILFFYKISINEGNLDVGNDFFNGELILMVEILNEVDNLNRLTIPLVKETMTGKTIVTL